MSNIPAARQALFDFSARLTDAEARSELVLIIRDHLYRRPQARPSAGVRSKRITATLRDDIKRAIEVHPDAHFTEIATQFGVNPGRVSEIAHGDKDHL